MASAKTLQEWCCDTCVGYPGVEIKNMSTSFRNGLAFCAIIHKHRPNLIDFNSLSKDDAYRNNKLAFEVAETKLGIPALLDAEDMVSSEVPDCLSIITYLSQYYYFFNRKLCVGPSRWSSHTSVFSLTKSNKTDGQKHLQSSTDLETNKDDRFTDVNRQTVCNLCLKPVHLIQRHLIEGKIYHRGCFRCKECHCTLLPGSYTKGSDATSLICAYHVTKSQRSHPDTNQQITSAHNPTQRKGQTDFYSLSGVAITSVPCYSQKIESPGKLVYKTQTKGSGEVRDLLGLPPPSQPHAKEKTKTEADKNQPVTSVGDRKGQLNKAKTPELSSSCSQAEESSVFPVPAPRRSLDPAAVPVPAPRTKNFQTMSETSAADRQHKSSDTSHVISPKVVTNHPWMTIVHPGPWSQLPPAPPPIPLPRSKSVSMVQVSSSRPKKPPPNPFEEEETEDVLWEAPRVESANQSKPSEADNEDTHAAVCSRDAKNPSFQSEQKELFRERSKDAAADPVKDFSVAAPSAYRDSTRAESLAQTDAAAELTSTSTDTHILSRSLSVPAITSDLSQTYSAPVRLKGPPVTSSQSKPACKENPFDRKPGMSKSKTFQDLSSSRGPAPGHGFPLIKRKVQTDVEISLEDLQMQMSELRKHLEALEQQGVKLERNLRDCKTGKEEGQMFTEWISLNHERHILSRKDTELVYLTKQKNLEDRQADVEYELRCLLNKPDSEWSQEDRAQEQQLMGELVTIIEQRNQIISSLDQDRQRERQEDLLWEGQMKNKDFKKDEHKEPKKSKGRFKPAKVFKILNPKTDNSKD